jgi:hypothetical protein
VVARTVSSTKILGFFTTKVPIIILHSDEKSVLHRIHIRYMLTLIQVTLLQPRRLLDTEYVCHDALAAGLSTALGVRCV